MANCFYASHVINELTIDEDRNGLFVLIPSENEEDTSYTVRCHEHKNGVTAQSCSCKGFYYRHTCKHIEIVNGYWSNIYKPAPVKVAAPVKKERKPRNGLVRKVRNGGLVKVEQKPVAKIIELPVERKITDISTKGELNGSRAFSILR